MIGGFNPDVSIAFIPICADANSVYTTLDVNADITFIPHGLHMHIIFMLHWLEMHFIYIFLV